MTYESAEDIIKNSKEKRVLNEYAAKNENEGDVDQVKDAREGSNAYQHSEIVLQCECDDRDCEEKIIISTEEYEAVHHNTKQFIVFSKHVKFDIEKVIAKYPNYSLVEKLLAH